MTKKLITGSPILAIVMCFALLAGAEEPSRPYVDGDLTVNEKTKIEALKALGTKEAVERLRKEAFLVQEDYLNKAIYAAFTGRSPEAVGIAIDLLRLPRLQIINNKEIDRTQEMFVAKKILQIFPEESMPEISVVYNAGSALTKSNLIEALGNMEGLDARNMLISALDDKTFIGEEKPEDAGEPMRICDAAYNQLVLRYMIPDVLRTIGSMHTLEQRDYYISFLKQKI